MTQEDTGRRSALPATRASLKRKRLSREKALRCSATAVWSCDLDTGVAFFAPEWSDILGIPGRERLGNSLDALLFRLRAQDRQLLRNHCEQLASGERDSLDLAVRCRRHDHTWAWVLLRGKIDDAPDGPRLLTGIGIEVSRLRLDRRFSPPPFKEGQSSYRSLLEHSPNAIVRLDRELFPLYINPAVTSLMPCLPCPPGEFGAKRLAELGMSQPDIDFIQANVEHVFNTGEVLKSRRSMSTSYGAITLEFTFWPEYDARGKVRSVLSQQRDLTAEAERAKEIYSNEIRFASLLQLTRMTNASEDEMLRFTVEKAAELTGSEHAHLYLPSEDPEGRGALIWSKSLTRFFCEEELARFNPLTVQEEFGFSCECGGESVVPILQGGPLPATAPRLFRDRLSVRRSLCAQALEDGDAVCLISVYNKDADYSDADLRQLRAFINGAWLIIRRRRHMAELKKAKESAERANGVKDRFLATVSHELRTPLNGVLSMLQLLEGSPLSPEQEEYVKSAVIAGRTLMRLISDLLDFSKMQTGQFVFEETPFDFKATLNHSVSLFLPDAAEWGINLMLSTAGPFPKRVFGDEARVRQILFNLVGNALKFTERGEVEVFCEASPGPGEMTTMRLSVRDTGIGIPLDMHAKVFDAFTQVDEPPARGRQGTGLGLGIVRELTRLMGGSVVLRSCPGRGTLVECALPFRLAPALPPAAGERAAGGEKAFLPDCPPLHVLVAEDDAVSRRAMCLFLEKLGLRPVSVTNGREALEALRLFPFDCLISDVLMPEMDGLEVARHIREGLAESFTPSEELRERVFAALSLENTTRSYVPVDRKLPVIAVSAHAMNGDKERFLAQGMDAYLAKPVILKELAAILAAIAQREIS
ncbi:MAG: response regulator [Deltaproteobacteria bacterium]|jgi:signal transduction histidine kinase/CheY-like chemotaxis protein|nr:response regulator [Deltaproteobacteria bacterium]